MKHIFEFCANIFILSYSEPLTDDV